MPPRVKENLQASVASWGRLTPAEFSARVSSFRRIFIFQSWWSARLASFRSLWGSAITRRWFYADKNRRSGYFASSLGLLAIKISRWISSRNWPFAPEVAVSKLGDARSLPMQQPPFARESNASIFDPTDFVYMYVCTLEKLISSSLCNWIISFEYFRSKGFSLPWSYRSRRIGLTKRGREIFFFVTWGEKKSSIKRNLIKILMRFFSFRPNQLSPR